jgi:putative oxidoreductase
MSRSRDAALLGTRLVLGGYLAAHGAQKLFGWFDGPGLDAAGAGFDHIGLHPGRPMAAVAGLSEFGGGLLTMAGLADPLGPVALAGTMAVASTVHRESGPLSAKGGFELPLTNLGTALALAVSGPGRYSVDGITGRRLTRGSTRLLLLAAAVASAGPIAMLLRKKPEAVATAEEPSDGPTLEVVS